MVMEANAVGFPWGWNKILQDSCGNVAVFDSCGASAATKITCQPVEGCLL